MDKTQFRCKLQELVDELPYLLNGEDTDCIYTIDDLSIYGDFEEGYRGVDHNILKFNDVTWEEILTYGVLIVPETKTYISDKPLALYDDLGYNQLPTTKNHIVGL